MLLARGEERSRQPDRFSVPQFFSPGWLPFGGGRCGVARVGGALKFERLVSELKAEKQRADGGGGAAAAAGGRATAAATAAAAGMSPSSMVSAIRDPNQSGLI